MSIQMVHEEVDKRFNVRRKFSLNTRVIFSVENVFIVQIDKPDKMELQISARYSKGSIAHARRFLQGARFFYMKSDISFTSQQLKNKRFKEHTILHDIELKIICR